MITTLIIIVLLVLNGFFVAAEFALVKAKVVRLESSASTGSGAASLTVRIHANLEAYLAACQLGITMASLGLGWVGEPAVAALLEPLFSLAGASETVTHMVSFLIGFLLFSSLHIVIGEQVPKTFAIRRPEAVSMLVAYPLHAAFLLVWPLNWVLNKTSAGILSWFNVEEATHGDVFTAAELKDLVTTSQDHGGIEDQKAEMLRNLFEFDQNTVERVMIPRFAVRALDVAQSADENRRTVFESGHSRFPVIDSGDNNRIVGVLMVKSILRALTEAPDKHADTWAKLEDYCRTPLIVPETQKVSILFDHMREQRNHLALVVDEYGEFCGIATLEDLLEEIVGEIEDETDVALGPENIVQMREFSWIVQGITPLTDFERYFSVALPQEIDSNSLSGFIMERLQRIPGVGSTLIESGYQLTVLKVTDSRVLQVRVEPLSGPFSSTALL